MSNKKSYFKRYYRLHKSTIMDNVSQWQKENKEKVRLYKNKSKVEHKNEIRLFVESIKKQSVCSCGESYHRCLDFHHHGEKTKSISTMISDGDSLKKIQKEIEVCSLICSNCHRKLHFKNISSNRTLKFKYSYEYKVAHPCVFCKESHYSCLDFHHLRDKIDTLGHMTKMKEYTLDDVKKEIEKCIVVCSNCHRKLHDGIIKTIHQ